MIEIVNIDTYMILNKFVNKFLYLNASNIIESKVLLLLYVVLLNINDIAYYITHDMQ